MPEKIKITKAEIAELYDITDDKQEVKEESNANATFEEYTQDYDEKEWAEEIKNSKKDLD